MLCPVPTPKFEPHTEISNSRFLEMLRNLSDLGASVTVYDTCLSGEHVLEVNLGGNKNHLLFKLGDTASTASYWVFGSDPFELIQYLSSSVGRIDIFVASLPNSEVRKFVTDLYTGNHHREDSELKRTVDKFFENCPVIKSGGSRKQDMIEAVLKHVAFNYFSLI